MESWIIEWFRAQLIRNPGISGHVLEVGGANINGSVRPLFPWPRFTSYFSIDATPGPGVDGVVALEDFRALVVAAENATRLGVGTLDARVAGLLPKRYGVVVSTEMLEHHPNPFGAVKAMRDLVYPGGHLMLSACGYGHVEKHFHPGDYFRFSPDGLRSMLLHAGLDPFVLDESEGAMTVYAIARRQ